MCAETDRPRQTKAEAHGLPGHPRSPPTQQRGQPRERRPYLRRLVNGRHFRPDAQRDVFVLSVPSIQVPEMLVPCLPPEVKEAISNCVILKHDIVHVSVFL